ncbi:MAG: photoactive yellow protein [Planctomycetota bacterium]|jgi:photoactive yellow protein
MGSGLIGGAVTFGLCLDCMPILVGTPIEDLSGLDGNEVHQLPYGVIRLDANDRVAAYNMDESRRSRLPLEKVIGRHFFTEIAPCTNVQEMAGWIAASRAAGKPARERLKFVFKFPFGKELVDVALIFDPYTSCAHILVHGIGDES